MNSSMISRGSSSTILWLSGWSMPDTVFDRIRLLLPEYHHLSVDYSEAETPEKMLLQTEIAVENYLRTSALHGPLLIGGWSLGALLALRLAAKGFGDGLVLFAATARFTRSKEEGNRGWQDVYVRKMMTGVVQDRLAVETKFRQLMFTEAEWEAHLGESLPPIGSWATPALIAGLQILRSEEILSQLLNIYCPVLLVHGTEDRICPYGAVSELLAQLPKAKLLPIHACGHVPFLGREERIADELRRWWHEQ
ncbi:alpha/beta hydrolase [Paenibacillus ferrarius]|uniref:Alpha/beta hydrolase n=1 Tax=Paenibacillus ferrarius TaxID=1469647 RepID=A0A1V4HKP2_9BACL|nr:alpha/beta hydrolase [Paenibacillus ferrarius]OPH57865.1 alpha/beta hydrolase [Paenibacillus ferrarius]